MKVRIGMLALAAVLVTSVLVLQPPQAHANCSACLTGTPHSVTCWSKASSCAAAQSNLVLVCAQTANEEQNCGEFGGACNVTITSQSACFWNGMQYQIDATASHGCVYCGQ